MATIINGNQMKTMTGADGSNAGTKGAVPAPGATDNTKFLRGDGTWATAGGGGGGTRSSYEIVPSVLPLSDNSLQLLDGTVITSGTLYNEIMSLYTQDPTASYFTQGGGTQYTTVGNPTVNGSIVTVSSASTKQYVLGTTNFVVSGATPWEIGGKFYFTGNNTYFWGKGLFGQEGSSYYCVLVNLNSSNKFTLLLGQGWTIANAVAASTAISLNTWYYLKLYFTGTKYCLDVSTDNTNWTTYITVNSTNPANLDNGNYPVMIGANPYNTSTSGSMNGSIDLTYCYLKIGSSEVWRAVLSAEDEYNIEVAQTGSCGKFYVDTANNSVKIPTVKDAIQYYYMVMP